MGVGVGVGVGVGLGAGVTRSSIEPLRNLGPVTIDPRSRAVALSNSLGPETIKPRSKIIKRPSRRIELESRGAI